MQIVVSNISVEVIRKNIKAIPHRKVGAILPEVI